MINSKALFKCVADFNSDAVFFNAQGVIGNPAPSMSTNIDYLLVDDCFLTGGHLRVKNATFGDSMNIQVVDLNGMIAPAGTVLRQFVTNWFISDGDDNQADFDLPYPAKVYAGLFIRLIYNSIATVGSPQTQMAMNYDLHKAMF